MLNDRSINELTKLFKRHVKASDGEKVPIEKEMRKYGCSSAAEAFKKIRKYRTVSNIKKEE